MGTKGATDSLNVAFGSNTILAMEKIRNCPVMAIPMDTVFTSITEIVFPTSFKTHFKKRELEYLLDIAKITNAAIRVLHVEQENVLTEIQQNYKLLLEDYFDGFECSFHYLEAHRLSEAVALFVQSRGSGMIAFINKKHTFFASIFTKPLVKELGMSSKVPVLALHDFRN